MNTGKNFRGGVKMSNQLLKNMAESCIVAQRIDPRDVTILVRDTAIETREAAELLISIELNVRQRAEQWNGFFLAALADYFLYVERPTAHISGETAEWLLARLSGPNQRLTPLVREFLVTLVGEAEACDPRIAALAFGAGTDAARGQSFTTSVGWLDAGGISC
jgi:hypothetical protein